MVSLVSTKEQQQLNAREEATRSGADLVPAVIRDAGSKAIESYLCFFAQFTVRGKTAACGYRSQSRLFFQWCRNAGISLDAIRAGHVVAFQTEMREQYKPSTLSQYLRAVRRLFAHLESDRIIERSPFVGVDFPARPKRMKATLAELKSIVHEIGYDEKKLDEFNASMVVLYPVVVGGMNAKRIAAFTGIPSSVVELYVQRLRENGVWTPEGKICLECEPDSDEAYTEFIMQVMCALGEAVRRDVAECESGHRLDEQAGGGGSVKG